MPRPSKCRKVSGLPASTCFKPAGIPLCELEEETLSLDGLEAIRLADVEGLGMEEAAARMGVSRHTFGRILAKAHDAVGLALVRGNALRVEGGHIRMAPPEEPSAALRNTMSEDTLIAVPSNTPGGLDASPSAHFGHCDMYTIARVQNGEIVDVKTVPNNGHEHGNCLAPVQELAAQGVKALAAGGMGMRPLAAMHAAGMHVYYTAGLATVGEVIRAYAAGKLVEFGEDQLCKGNCGHHH